MAVCNGNDPADWTRRHAGMTGRLHGCPGVADGRVRVVGHMKSVPHSPVFEALERRSDGPPWHDLTPRSIAVVKFVVDVATVKNAFMGKMDGFVPDVTPTSVVPARTTTVVCPACGGHDTVALFSSVECGRSGCRNNRTTHTGPF